VAQTPQPGAGLDELPVAGATQHLRLDTVGPRVGPQEAHLSAHPSKPQDKAGGTLRVNIDGDLQGWCAWQFSAEGPDTRAEFSQEVEVTARVLRRAPLAVRPLLRGNHTHMMRSGERGLRHHLASPRP